MALRSISQNEAGVEEVLSGVSTFIWTLPHVWYLSDQKLRHSDSPPNYANCH